ncbi:putative sporulation protein YtxC [Bacillus sp. V3B]|uniref:putative sporulation protein YtxC n=1 Tax=Bacillus sp. V3B TaxID=2804915 RepID=UPI00210C56E0|nr:putative sporulation protein YtxC [Bacillus sp. V3B]MCQ6273447.1 putative sporulation protein YtxC [Bacillus sp. V3B]
MIEIHFQQKEDAKRMYLFLQQQSLNYESLNKNILHYEDSHIVQCSNKDGSTSIKENEWVKGVKKALFQFIMTIKLNDWLRHILSHHYHYRDEDEQEQIIEIVHSVLDGKLEELTVFLPKMDIKEHLAIRVNDWFQEKTTFSFDSFVTFRLRSFMNELKKYVELSLDEYKMEQEYQMFIQTLRDFLLDREPKMNQLHLLFSDVVTFFDENFMEIKRGELAKMVDRKLLINHPVYIDSVTIAPLLSIAPKQIYIYSDDPEQPIIRTIRNIFEERLISRSIHSFIDYKNLSLSSVDEKA